MLTVLVSRWVGDSIQQGGIYDELIFQNKYPYLHDKDESYGKMTAADIMTPVNDLEVIDSGVLGHDIGTKCNFFE